MEAFTSKVAMASEEATLTISICNQLTKYSEISSEVKIHLLTSLMRMTIFSKEDLEVGVDLETWEDLDKWVDFMKGLDLEIMV